MKLLPKIILYITMFCVSNFLVAQMPSYVQYETSNGLPSNEIYCIKQSQQGFLWLGSDAGLIRYDGTRFKTYTNNQSRGNSVSCLREDKLGRMWCTNFSGQIFYVNADTLALFTPFEKLYKTHYAEIDFDENNNLIVSCGVDKIYRFDITNFTLQIINTTPNSSSQYPFKTHNNKLLCSELLNVSKLQYIHQNKLTNIPFVTEKDIAITIPFLNKFNFVTSFKNQNTLCFQSFHPASPLPNIYSFINNKMVLHEVSYLLEKLHVYPQTVYDDDDGNLFVGTTKELLWVKKNSTHNWSLFTTMFIGNSVSCIVKDKEQNIWISTLKNGLFKIANNQLYNLNIDAVKAKSIGVNHLITNNKNTIYGSHLSGEVFEFNTATHTLHSYYTPEQRDVQTLKYNAFNQQLFIGKTQSFIVNTTNKLIQPTTIDFTNAKDVSFTKEGIIYKATNFLEVLIPKEKTNLIKEVLNNYDTINKKYYFNNDGKTAWKKLVLKEQRCKAVCYIEPTKTLWAGFIDGLNCIKNKQIIKVVDPQTRKSIIASQFIYDTINNLLFIGTIKQGIFIIKYDKIINQINTKNGLQSNEIKSFRVYKNTIWIVGNSKVESYNLLTKQVKIIDEQDGLLSKELYDIEVLNDTVYVASSKGVQYFPYNIETHNANVPIALIQYFKADDSLYNAANSIKLKATTKNIEINLLGIALKSNGNLQYQYRLLPNDSNWITVSALENVVRFSSLSSNEYLFESRVLNEDNVASNNVATIKFTIKKHWYWQWWFLMVMLCSIIFFVYLWYHFRVKKNEQQLKEQLEKIKIQEELRRSQLSSLKAQMNPHFMFNALNSIQEFIIVNDKQQANMFMGKFADLMRLTLDMSNKDEVVLEEELKLLNLYLELESLRFEEKFSYTIELNNQVNIAAIYLPPMLIQPYIENAVKHGLLHNKTNKILTIHFAIQQNNLLVCTIKDNGIGRKRSMEINTLRRQKHTSFATGATQKRLQLLNAQNQANIVVVYNDLIDNNKNALGTEVVINIPIGFE
jgi:ligand-binding sensor domain-containing protein